MVKLRWDAVDGRLVGPTITTYPIQPYNFAHQPVKEKVFWKNKESLGIDDICRYNYTSKILVFELAYQKCQAKGLSCENE